MARSRKSRLWVKIDCEGILRGSINYLLPLDEQAIWIKLIAFSEMCGGRSGYIEDNNGKGMPLEHIAHELHCPVETLNNVIEKMGKDGLFNFSQSLVRQPKTYDVCPTTLFAHNALSRKRCIHPLQQSPLLVFFKV